MNWYHVILTNKTGTSYHRKVMASSPKTAGEAVLQRYREEHWLPSSFVLIPKVIKIEFKVGDKLPA